MIRRAGRGKEGLSGQRTDTMGGGGAGTTTSTAMVEADVYHHDAYSNTSSTPSFLNTHAEVQGGCAMTHSQHPHTPPTLGLLQHNARQSTTTPRRYNRPRQ